MKITKIYHPHKKRKADRTNLRVAAYCRVSTSSEDQLNSFETQKSVFTEMIEAHEGWKLVDIYADRGLSGTRASKRPQFLRMIEDCECGLIDIILCKSVSRFSRNTQDSLFYIRHLLGLGVRLIFEKEEIDTGNICSEMMITIFAAFAEEESRSISENIKWRLRKKAMEGEVPLPRVYGYCRSGDNYEIVPEEAETIRMIFDLYEHGATIEQITDKLSEKGITSFMGNEKWHYAVIKDLLKNEKVVGDCRTLKYYQENYRSRKNRGEKPYVYIKNHHEGIVSRKQFERCGEILKLRNFTRPIKSPFAEYLRCPYCGHVLYFRSRNPYITHFYCDGEEGETACRKFIVHREEVKSAVLDAYNRLDINSLQKIIASGDLQNAKEAEKLLKTKTEHPAFETVDYWWLDEFVQEIRFGQHTFSGLESVNEGHESDDRTVSIVWKCGIVTTVPSGIKGDPRKKAENLAIRLARASGEQCTTYAKCTAKVEESYGE